MGGDVYVESEGIGKGTTFVIQLRSISGINKNAKISSAL
jgi:signal transduction histidine kinase